MLQLRIVEDIQPKRIYALPLNLLYRIPKIKLSELEHIHAPELVTGFDTLTIQKGLPKILIDFPGFFPGDFASSCWPCIVLILSSWDSFSSFFYG
ncbi:MAG: hypothetical protein IPJ40_21210 [Saprospirales bacterium]|nr:hypothetical protein [Saprospirales bacterium]